MNHLAKVKKLIQLNKLKRRIKKIKGICSADIALFPDDLATVGREDSSSNRWNTE